MWSRRRSGCVASRDEFVVCEHSRVDDDALLFRVREADQVFGHDRVTHWMSSNMYTLSDNVD